MSISIPRIFYCFKMNASHNGLRRGPFSKGEGVPEDRTRKNKNAKGTMKGNDVQEKDVVRRGKRHQWLDKWNAVV